MVNCVKELLNNLCENKKVLILGFGREGKSTLRLLASLCYVNMNITIGDKNYITQESIADTLETGCKYDIEKIAVSCGDDYLNNINDYDIVFKSPGIVLPKNVIHYKAYITSQTEEFLKAYRNRTVGITGTKGKSTVSTLTQKVLSDNGIEAVLGGNIGIPPFELVYDMEKNKNMNAILELSCHQLEYLDVSPHISVYLNLYEEHLDHYGTYEKYAYAKNHIYMYQKSEDLLICKNDIIPFEEEFKEEIPHILTIHQDTARKSIRAGIGESHICKAEKTIEITQNIIKDEDTGREEYFIPFNDIKLLGEHNYFNIAAVYLISRHFNIDKTGFEIALKNFVPLSHRLENIGTINQVTYYDDSISTIGETTIQAVNSVKNVNTVLIGGMDRGIDYQQLEEFLSKKPVENVVLMYETGRRIYNEMKEKGFETDNIKVVNDLKEAVILAKRITKPGNACIMSPAAASYGYFKNFEERGQEFSRLVKSN